MDTMQGDLPDRERRLGEVVFACLQALEEGHPPDLAEMQARHPEFATELAEFFADQAHLRQWAAPLRASVQAGVPEAAIEQGPTPNRGESAARPRASIAPGATRD